MFDELANQEQLVWCAIARVEDDDAVHVVEDGGNVLGTAVTCRIVDGPLVGTEVTATVGAPIGSGYRSAPVLKGDTLLLFFTHGHLDGPIVAMGTIPGGSESPIPGVVAGLKTDAKGVKKALVTAPPKDVGIYEYLRSAPRMTRLKGTAGWYIECDDGASMRIYNPVPPGPPAVPGFPSGWAFQFKDAFGASITVKNGAVIQSSPNGQNTITVKDAGITIIANRVDWQAQFNNLGGVFLFNVPAGALVPAMAALRGPAGPAGIPSLGVFIGA